MIRVLIVYFFLIQNLFVAQDKKTDSVSFFINSAKEQSNHTISSKITKEYLLKALQKASLTKNYNKINDCNFQLGLFEFENANYEEAINWFSQIINYNTKNKLISPQLANTYFYLGTCYQKNKNKLKNKLLEDIYFKKAIDTYINFYNIEDLYLIEMQLGLTYLQNNNLVEAEKQFLIVVNNNSKTDFIISEAHYLLGQIYWKQNLHEKAVEYLQKGYKIAEKDNNDAKKNKILNLLISIYEKKGDYKQANQYIRLHHSEVDHNKINNLLTKKEIDIALEKILKNDSSSINKGKEVRFSRLISILSIALISILSLLSFSLYKNNKIRIYTNKLLHEKNKELIDEKEKAILASNARSEFMSMVSHELRTPLNAINGLTYLLLKENPKESQLQYLKSLEFSGKYLLDYINDILEINRLESDKVELEKINFNLVQLIKNIEISFNEIVKNNNVKPHFSIELQNKENFTGDPTKLSQILINLLSNAIKFSKNGNVWFSAKIIDTFEDKNVIQFEIRDDGIGIPEDKIDTIFESFTQGSVAINRNYGGTGLGLSIVKKLIDLFDTTIKLESKINEGTKFTFNINLIENKNFVLEAKTPENQNLDVLNGKKVLLVEDNKINQMITKKMLENKGMECKIIETGEDCITEVSYYKYDIILMDVHLPGINGTDATKAIREFNTHTPIIALTAISLNENKETLLSYGMNDVITKPFIPEDFYKKIASYLSV